jgi:protein PhnA
MSDASPTCPACQSEYTYELNGQQVCSMCQHEFVPGEETTTAESAKVIRDSAGNVLADGDDVTVITDLKVKGASGPIKRGTKVRGIRLIDGVGDHDIDCKIDGFGPMQLKSSVVKKA